MGKQDALEAAKIGVDGEQVKKKEAKEQARDLVKAAATAMPSGVQANSPFTDMSRDAMLSEANRTGLTVAMLLSTDELRLVLEHQRQVKIATTPVASTPVGGKPREAPPPVPAPLPQRKRITGLKESPTNSWKVSVPSDRNGIQQRQISIGGQMVTMRTGQIIEQRHYEDKHLQAMIEQGIELAPILADD
jgi:hypothetical protein